MNKSIIVRRMVMFGKKETDKRSLEDMFTPRESDSESEERLECADEGCVDNNSIDSAITEKERINPFYCFGMEEGKTEKWLAKCVKFWFCCMSFVWFLFGALTFAPVIYISNKVNVIFKDKKKSLFCSAAFYFLFCALIAVLIVLR